jgi:hypothetical protein
MKSVFRNIANVFRHCLPAKHPASEHAQCSLRGNQLPEFRTRFHRKTYNGVLELGRVGFCAQAGGRELRLGSRHAGAKRAFITRCEDGGQTRVGRGVYQFEF